MDYEKKYKEALDNFKKIKAANKDNKELVHFIEYEYPELKKSEDGMIIDAIKHGLKCLGWVHINGIRIVDIVAWLEKQGEQILSNSSNIGKNAWSEEDEIGLDDALWAIEQARTIAKDETDMGNLWYAEHFLNSIKDRVQSQTKQEWSEDDEHRSKDAIYFLETARKHYASTEEIDACIDLLKSLKDRIRKIDNKNK